MYAFNAAGQLETYFSVILLSRFKKTGIFLGKDIFNYGGIRAYRYQSIAEMLAKKKVP